MCHANQRMCHRLAFQCAKLIIAKFVFDTRLNPKSKNPQRIQKFLRALAVGVYEIGRKSMCMSLGGWTLATGTVFAAFQLIGMYLCWIDAL